MNHPLPRCQSLIFYLIESKLRYQQLGQGEKKIDEQQNKMDLEVKNELVLGPAGWFQKAWSLVAAMGSICFSASLTRTRSVTGKCEHTETFTFTNPLYLIAKTRPDNVVVVVVLRNYFLLIYSIICYCTKL